VADGVIGQVEVGVNDEHIFVSLQNGPRISRIILAEL
jgi:hypothetical protein